MMIRTYHQKQAWGPRAERQNHDGRFGEKFSLFRADTVKILGTHEPMSISASATFVL